MEFKLVLVPRAQIMVSVRPEVEAHTPLPAFSYMLSSHPSDSSLQAIGLLQGALNMIAVVLSKYPKKAK